MAISVSPNIPLPMANEAGVARSGDSSLLLAISTNTAPVTTTSSCWLRDALRSEIELQTHANDMPTEHFKLNFTEILWSYSMQQAHGQPGAQHTAGWSLARNRPSHTFTA